MYWFQFSVGWLCEAFDYQICTTWFLLCHSDVLSEVKPELKKEVIKNLMIQGRNSLHHSRKRKYIERYLLFFVLSSKKINEHKMLK
ncbi:hypothetical protein PHAVU_002G250500 [Phaseolus vulgaris]|uniref:Uncharacterized protein n=1 Tax=Phaseolus vulgaris TaxID=3885 RepID=V7CMZ9_PHAVU|nr:hypothetical protein PHAVU_002G250500g [Phaseolus vulgaris]ESW31587.1 hypothetical protein PHAVU_002G250500g [Phaseolus vulgaris]